MFGISAVLTIPIAFIILTRIPGGIIFKTFLTMGVFLLLLFSIMLLYKQIFEVSFREITHDDKMTRLDKLFYKLTEKRKEHTNNQVLKCIDAACQQIQQFNRRKDVMLHLADEETGSSDNALWDLVVTVEDALYIYMERVANRIEVFDDKGMPEIIWDNIAYIEEQLRKINDILKEFEILINETSRMGEIHEDKDISKLRDVVNAMKSLRTDQEDDFNDLKNKYEKG